MKKSIYLLTLGMLIAFATAAIAQNVSNYNEQGGARTVVGGSIDIISGGEIDVEAGGALKIAGTAATASAAELNYLDITTLGTAAASKALTFDASLDAILPTGTLLTLASGGDITAASGSTLDVAGTFEIANVAMTSSAAELNYNDITTLGTAQASKALTFDSSLDAILPTGAKVTINSGGELVLPTGAALTVDTVAVNHASLALPGRATIWICGDAITVNNNTVYYGPSQTVAANSGRACDIAAAGNVTEATADAPAFPATAFQVLSWYCLQPDAGADLTYTLRSAAAALTPANAITVLDNALGGTSTTATTTAIASGATLAIAVSSGVDVGTAQFACALNVAY